MIKHFSYGASSIYGGMGTRTITVSNNTITIIQQSSGLYPLPTPTVTQDKSITYNDMNITGFYEDIIQSIDPIPPHTVFRHIDVNEPLPVETYKFTYPYYDVDIGEAVGTETLIKTTECFYAGIKDKVLKNEIVIKEGGKYLLIECTKTNKYTYTIDEAYKEVVKIENRSDITKYFHYYEKDIGLIYRYSSDNYTYQVDEIDYNIL